VIGKLVTFDATTEKKGEVSSSVKDDCHITNGALEKKRKGRGWVRLTLAERKKRRGEYSRGDVPCRVGAFAKKEKLTSDDGPPPGC